MSESPWRPSDRYDPAAVALADRHYNRQKPGTPQFIAPGTHLALIAADKTALWVTRWPKYSQHAWRGAWENTLFRKEGSGLASEMIRHAVAHTRAKWPRVPALGMVTFVNASKVRSTNPGYCYLMAGFRHVGFTKGGLHVFQMLEAWDMPAAVPVPGSQAPLFEVTAGAA